MSKSEVSDNWTAPSRAEIDAALDALLSKGRIACEGDFPKVSAETIGEMSELFRMIARAVSEPDVDGDFNFNISVIDKFACQAPAHWVRAPIEIKTKADIVATIRAAEALSNAASRLMAESAFAVSVQDLPEETK